MIMSNVFNEYSEGLATQIATAKVLPNLYCKVQRWAETHPNLATETGAQLSCKAKRSNPSKTSLH